MNEPIRTRRAPNSLVLALLASTAAGGYVKHEEINQLRDDQQRSHEAAQHCQERESDRMWQTIHGRKP